MRRSLGLGLRLRGSSTEFHSRRDGVCLIFLLHLLFCVFFSFWLRICFSDNCYDEIRITRDEIG